MNPDVARFRCVRILSSRNNPGLVNSIGSKTPVPMAFLKNTIWNACNSRDAYRIITHIDANATQDTIIQNTPRDWEEATSGVNAKGLRREGASVASYLFGFAPSLRTDHLAQQQVHIADVREQTAAVLPCRCSLSR